MGNWLIQTTHLLTENIKKQPTKSYFKNILSLLLIYLKLNVVQDLSKDAMQTSTLLRNLAIDSLSLLETEVKVFSIAYGKLFLQSLLKFLNGVISSQPTVIEWIFAIPIVHFLTGQQNCVNVVDWNEDHSNFKYVWYLFAISIVLVPSF